MRPEREPEQPELPPLSGEQLKQISQIYFRLADVLGPIEIPHQIAWIGKPEDRRRLRLREANDDEGSLHAIQLLGDLRKVDFMADTILTTRHNMALVAAVAAKSYGELAQYMDISEPAARDISKAVRDLHIRLATSVESSVIESRSSATLTTASRIMGLLEDNTGLAKYLPD
jgi:hypothetical protein